MNLRASKMIACFLLCIIKIKNPTIYLLLLPHIYSSNSLTSGYHLFSYHKETSCFEISLLRSNENQSWWQESKCYCTKRANNMAIKKIYVTVNE